MSCEPLGYFGVCLFHFSVLTSLDCAEQTCVTANRILIHEKIFQQVVDGLAAAMDRELKVGPGLDPTSSQGPIINERQLLKVIPSNDTLIGWQDDSHYTVAFVVPVQIQVESLVNDAVNQGASAVRGGKRHQLGHLYYEPTLLVDVKAEMSVFQEEIFGPVAALLSFKTEDEAIRLANDCERGLAGMGN